jgi:hypothetical protein
VHLDEAGDSLQASDMVITPNSCIVMRNSTLRLDSGCFHDDQAGPSESESAKVNEVKIGGMTVSS